MSATVPVLRRLLRIAALVCLPSQVYAQVAPRQCGYERWPVKILADKDRSRVDLTPIDTTVAFGAITRFVKFDSRKYIENPANYSLQEAWVKSTNIAPELVSHFLGGYISATPDGFAEEIRARDLGQSDFTPFRRRPLFKDEANLFLLDFAFLVEKVETGPFWTVHEWLQSDDERDLLHSFWGSVFERYTSDLVESADGELNAICPSPIYADRDEQVCDAIVVCGNAAAFVEIKGSTFSAKAKYGGKPHDLRVELERKLVQSDGTPKAVQQLATAIEKTCTYSNAKAIRGIDLRKGRDGLPRHCYSGRHWRNYWG